MSERTLEEEIADHAFNPKNYGVLEDADGVGVGVDPSGVYLIFYLRTEGDRVTEATYATSGSQDAITLASMLSEMVIEDTLEAAAETIKGLEADVEALYAEKLERIAALKAAGSKSKISMKEQDNASMVLAALKAALINRENRMQGEDEEQHRITIELRGGKSVKRGCVN